MDDCAAGNMASACVFLPLFLVEASQRPWLTGLSTSTCPVTVNAVIMNSIQMLKSCKYSITMIVPHYTPAGKLGQGSVCWWG